ncbi:MAG: ATP-binding cassette domain-containing protein [Planctomycetota bacterium]|nr:ATP-binding cassette domain-containing protein [Planctomycetota bacterium]
MATIELRDVHKSFGAQKVLEGLSFSVEQGQSLVLMGPSGSGKSVILKHLIGLLKPDHGEVEVMGKSVPELSGHELSLLRKDMGYLFQHSALLNWMSVFDNVALPLREGRDCAESEIRERVQKVLALVMLEGAELKLPEQLSGGMQKRVGLARALVTEPKVILYDEPEAGLDPEMSASISATIRRLQEELGTTSVTVTHSTSCAKTVGDLLAVFEKGRIIVSGPPAEVLASELPRVREFLGTPID